MEYYRIEKFTTQDNIPNPNDDPNPFEELLEEDIKIAAEDIKVVKKEVEVEDEVEDEVDEVSQLEKIKLLLLSKWGVFSIILIGVIFVFIFVFILFSGKKIPRKK